MTRFILLLLLFASLSACASGPVVFTRRPEQPMRWPNDAQEARISFSFSYGSLADSERSPGFWTSLGHFVVGEETRALAAPYGPALAEQGDLLWIADPGKGLVHRLSLLSGEHRYLRGLERTPFRSPVGVAVLPDGRVVVSDSTAERLVLLDAEGEAIGRFAPTVPLGRPTGLAWDPVGNRLLVLDTIGGRVLSFALDGTLLQVAGGPGEEAGFYNHPTNLAVAADGRVFLTDSLNFRVQVLASDLHPLNAFGIAGTGPGTFSKPKGIALDSQGHVYVVDGMFDNVQVFDQDGQLLLVFGRSGSGLGEFLLPTGIHIDAQDRIFLADSGNSRIQVFQFHPIAP